MIDKTVCIDICQAFQSKLMAFGFEFDPRNQSLFNNPALGTIKACCNLINLVG
jgi:hypothetical protein